MNKIFFLVVFLLISTSLMASSSCKLKVYTQRAVPAMDFDCDDLMNQDDPWCEINQDDSKYAVTWVDMLKPKQKINVKDISLDACLTKAIEMKNSIVTKFDQLDWGMRVKYDYKDNSGSKASGTISFKNPNYIERK